MAGTQRDSRFECACQGQVVYRSDCPREVVGRPRCVCGRELAALAEDHGAARLGGEGDGEGSTTGEKLLCECGAKVEFLQGCTCGRVAPFRCTCRASATTVAD